ncbi:hypothetical protein [Cecembia lonarensis]|uniref:Uncharacterized protein n=1 Tax=Cecembia lonarensis (strain CCUG 58316 / KCTC 22772 / LW9) TaxID=1225176 RepID=K1LE82_CECL9|nr:hypothetical protein [Cecembia lonarensis]EKB50492.1 hypothetical protein B879_00874 [Cecembia lonarensis LW9]
MPKPILFISLFLIFSSYKEIKAQKGYEPGYIVTKAFDTIPGSIKDRKEAPFAKLYFKIRFKSMNSRDRRYSPKQIQGYAKGEDIFESQWILRYSRLFKTEYLSRKDLGKPHFLNVREKGFLTYYQWEFMDQESSTVDAVDLFKRENEDYFIRVTQGLLGLRIAALEKYFEDCPELMDKIRSKEFRTPMEIARFYNNWNKVK